MITIWQVMVERELALALERRCGGGEHCCRFLFCSWHDNDDDGDGDGDDDGDDDGDHDDDDGDDGTFHGRKRSWREAMSAA